MSTIAITVRYTDGTERTVTVNRAGDGTADVRIGDGWREFFAAPLVNIKDWG